MIQEKQAYRVPIGDLVLRPGRQDHRRQVPAWICGTPKSPARSRPTRARSASAPSRTRTIWSTSSRLKPTRRRSGSARGSSSPACPRNPRWRARQAADPRRREEPGRRSSASDGTTLGHVLQKVFNGDEYATVWKRDEHATTGARCCYQHRLRQEGRRREPAGDRSDQRRRSKRRAAAGEVTPRLVARVLSGELPLRPRHAPGKLLLDPALQARQRHPRRSPRHRPGRARGTTTRPGRASGGISTSSSRTTRSTPRTSSSSANRSAG